MTTLQPPLDSRSSPQRGAPPAPPCDVCGGPTVETRCKIVCRRCGYTRDCSDP